MLQKVRNPLSAILGVLLLAFCLPGWAQVAQPQTGSIAIDAYNGLAVTVERSGLVQLFNVKNPQSPAFVSKLIVSDQLNSVALAGNYVLAAGQNGVHIVDISNPQYPAIGNTVPLKAEAVAVKAAGNLGYAAFGSTLALFDIPSGTLLDQRDYSTLPVNDLALAGDFVYVLSAAANGAASYVVTKIAIQSYLDAALASFKSPSTQQSGVGRMSIYAGDNFVYVGGAPAATGEALGIEVLQDNGATLATVGAASPIDALVVRPSGSGLLVFGGAQNPAGNGGLGILDISDPTITNKLLKPLSAAGVPYDFLLYSGLAYVADGSSTFQADSFAAPTGQKTAPSLTLATNFAAGTAVESSLMRLTASVTGADQIRSVDFYVNDVKVATDGNYPFEYRFVTPDLAMEASLTIYACAQDIDGNRSCSAPTKVDLEKDKTPLRVLSVTPQDGSHAAKGGISTLTARFNRPLDLTTVVLTNVTLAKNSGSAATPVKLAGVTFQPLINVVTMQTATPLASGSYTAALTAAIKSSSGVPLAGGKLWHFTSGGTAVWTAAASGNWSVGANWAAGVPPQPGDAVTITVPNVTVTLNSGTPSISTLTLGASSQLSITASSLTIASASTLSGTLSLSAGTLTATGGVTISSLMNWTGGTITGVVTIASTATLTAIGEYAGPGLLMTSGTLNNAGKATLTQVAGSNGLTLYAGSVINNLAGASWTTSGAVALYVQAGDSTAVAFNNAGSFVSANTATTTWSVAISGAGPISVTGGTLTLNGNSTGTISGTISVASGVTLNYGQGGTLTGGPETGSGTFNFTAGATVSGAYSFSGQTQITSGTISFGGTTSIANLSLAGTAATMAGAGAVTIGSTMTWTYGTISDVVNIPSTATLTATGEYSGPGLQMVGGTLNNSGKVTLTQVAGSNGLTLYTGSLINNLAGASWTTSGAVGLYVQAGDSTAVRFSNAGSFVSANTSTTTWSVPFSGAGSISVTGGTLTFNGNSTGTISGTISVASGATLNYGQGGTLTGGPETGSGTFNFTAGATVSGAYSFSGQTQISSGTISFGGATSIANLSLAGTAATMAGAGTVTIGSTMTWTYGTISDVVNIPGAATLAATGEYSGPGLQMVGGTLNNSGKVTATQVAGSNGLTLYRGSVINNLAGASWTTSGAVALYVQAGDSTAVGFNNAGSFVSGNTATTTWSVPFSGAGSISVTSGTLTLNGNSTGTISGTISVASDATLNYGQGGTLTGGPETGSGTFNFTAGATVSGAYSFSGQTQISSGTISFGGATSIANLSLAGTAATMAGAGAVTIGSTMTWTYGTISDVVNIPSTATLTATGEYSGPGLQMVGGTLNNSGKVTLTQVAGSNGLTLYTGSLINNLAGASWTTSGAVALYVSAGDSTAVAFRNSASFVSANTSTTTWSVPFSGAGPISVSSGTLTFNGNSSGTISGTISVASGATLNYGQGGTLTGGPETGSGTVNFTAGATVSGAYSFSGQTQITSGTISFGGATAIANLSLAGTAATMAGAGAVTIGSTMTWTYGTISDVVNIPSTATLTATGEYSGRGLQMVGGTLNNSGKVTLTQVAGSNGLTLYTGSVINNLAGASWTTSGAVALYVSAGDSTAVAFRNSASFVSGNTSTTTWSVPFSGAGAISVSSGTLTLNGNSTGTISGTISVASDATLNYGQGGTLTGGPETGSGTFNFTAGAMVSGAYGFSGQTQITSGTISFGGATAIANLSLTGSAATMGGSGAVTVSNAMTWTYGTISDVVNIASTATFTATGEYAGPGLQMVGGTLNNSGKATLTQVAGSNGLTLYTGSVINNLAGASWTTGGAVNLSVSMGDSTAVAFHNAGTFATGNTAATSWGVPTSGAGLFSLTVGTISFGAYNCTGQTQIAGATANFGGATSIANLTFSSGTLGAGDISAGNVTFETSGSVAIDFPSVTMSVSGSASLAGALNLITPNGYAPTVGSVIQLLGFSGSHSGNFSSITGRTLGNGDFLDEDLLSSGLFFKVASASPTLQSIAVTPANPSIEKGSSVQLTATGIYSDGSMQNLTSSVAWASSATTVATINASGLASSVAVGTSNITASISGIVSPADLLTVTPSSAAAYGGLDTATQGTWTGKYGADGQLIAGDATNPPGYATVSLTGDTVYTWAASTSDVRALQTASGATSRIASAYYSSTSFTIDVNLTDGNTHRVALYLLDWDSSARSESVSILDAASNTVLSTLEFSSFHDGEYAVWNIQGHVLIQVTKIGGSNAVVSGIFFAPVTPSATYSGLDTATQGTWTGKYGADGELIAGDVTNAPAYATVSLTGDAVYTWAASTTDVRALQTSSGSSTRIASAYYAGANFAINLNLTDGNSHRVSLYLLDWDGNSRVESISIVDAMSNVVLSTETFTNFHDGEYAVWDIQGHVLIQVTKSDGSNAVVSGVFFN